MRSRVAASRLSVSAWICASSARVSASSGGGPRRSSLADDKSHVLHVTACDCCRSVAADVRVGVDARLAMTITTAKAENHRFSLGTGLPPRELFHSRVSTDAAPRTTHWAKTRQACECLAVARDAFLNAWRKIE